MGIFRDIKEYLNPKAKQKRLEEEAQAEADRKAAAEKAEAEARAKQEAEVAAANEKAKSEAREKAIQDGIAAKGSIRDTGYSVEIPDPSPIYFLINAFCKGFEYKYSTSAIGEDSKITTSSTKHKDRLTKEEFKALFEQEIEKDVYKAEGKQSWRRCVRTKTGEEKEIYMDVGVPLRDKIFGDFFMSLHYLNLRDDFSLQDRVSFVTDVFLENGANPLAPGGDYFHCSTPFTAMLNPFRYMSLICEKMAKAIAQQTPERKRFLREFRENSSNFGYDAQRNIMRVIDNTLGEYSFMLTPEWKMAYENTAKELIRVGFADTYVNQFKDKKTGELKVPTRKPGDEKPVPGESVMMLYQEVQREPMMARLLEKGRNPSRKRLARILSDARKVGGPQKARKVREIFADDRGGM